jgi:hypothetical protein
MISKIYKRKTEENRINSIFETIKKYTTEEIANVYNIDKIKYKDTDKYKILEKIIKKNKL